MEIIEYDWVKQTRHILLAQCRMLSEQELVAESNFGTNVISAKTISDISTRRNTLSN